MFTNKLWYVNFEPALLELMPNKAELNHVEENKLSPLSSPVCDYWKLEVGSLYCKRTNSRISKSRDLYNLGLCVGSKAQL